MLALENNVMELQMFLDKAQGDLAAAKEDLAVMETEHKELANEYIALKTSHVQLTADYQKEVCSLYISHKIFWKKVNIKFTPSTGF